MNFSRSINYLLTYLNGAWANNRHQAQLPPQQQKSVPIEVDDIGLLPQAPGIHVQVEGVQAAPVIQTNETTERAQSQAHAINSLVGFIKRKEMMASYLLKSAKGNFNDLTYVQKIALQQAREQVHFLDLSGVPLTVESIKNIQAHFPNLRTFIAKDSQLTDDCIKVLRMCPQLTRVNIEANPQLTDEALLSLSEVSTLQELCLSDDNYSDQGITHLKKLKNLTSLRLKDCAQITDALGQAIRAFAKLTELHLVRCAGITNVGVADFFTENSLKKLTLADCLQVSDETKVIFAEYEGLTFFPQEQPLTWNQAAPFH